MKKVLFGSVSILLALISTPAVSNATQKSGVKKEPTHVAKAGNEEPSYRAAQALYGIYGDLPNVQWKRTKRFEEASFELNGLPMVAYFNLNAELTGTTTEKKFTDIPASAQEKIKNQYKDYEVGKVVFYDDNEDNDADMILFEDHEADADNYFVELKKDNKAIVVEVSPFGTVNYFDKE